MSSHSPTAPNWRIEPMTTETTPEVLSFINKARFTMFPTLSAQLTPDTASWLHTGTFLTARTNTPSTSGDLIATIGYIPYNNRFPHLHFQASYRGLRTVEVVRLFVSPAYRRRGIGRALFAALRECARREGVQCFYLHTHEFLVGAVGFWAGCGFVVREREEGVWETVHLDLAVDLDLDSGGGGRCRVV